MKKVNQVIYISENERNQILQSMAILKEIKAKAYYMYQADKATEAVDALYEILKNLPYY